MENFVTMITPYKSDGTVDLNLVDAYVDWYFESGVDGIFAVCQSSEIFWLSLEERVELNRRVYRRAKALEQAHGRPFPVISSGHISDTLEDQVRELNAIWESGTDGLILITNRLDVRQEGDDAFIRHGEQLLAQLPQEAKLGLYECPHPYKRLVTPKILDWCKETGRFYYMKDTCCDAAEIARRCRQLEGSTLKLYNANCQTLLETVRNGAAGYCGIMCNFHPKLYAWLAGHLNDPKADVVQGVLGTFGFTEVGLPYPLTAKYHMGLCGMETENRARNRVAAELTEYAKSCMRQMKTVTDRLEQDLGI